MGTVFVLLRTICQSVLTESLQFQAECVEKEEEEDNMKRKKDGLRERLGAWDYHHGDYILAIFVFYFDFIEMLCSLMVLYS